MSAIVSPGAASAGALLPLGGSYADVLPGFATAAVANAVDGQVRVIVVPTPYASNPVMITPAERARGLADAEKRRGQIEAACRAVAPAGVTCRAILLPVFTREDACDPSAILPFSAPISAAFILGGAQTVAMSVLADTPVEHMLARAHAEGAVIGGTSAGAGMLSVAMLAGYADYPGAGKALEAGAVDVWHKPGCRGLSFGVESAILDQHFFQRGRPGRLLNAITQRDVPHLGVGIDAHTGVHIREGRYVEDVFGGYGVAVLDAETYHAAADAKFRGDSNILSVRNVLVHLLMPGNGAYDLQERHHSLAPPPLLAARAFDGLCLPAGAGTLILAGDLRRSLEGNAVLDRFLDLALERRGKVGASQARILVYADGYLTAWGAEAAAEKYAGALASCSRAAAGDVQTLTYTRNERMTGAMFPLPDDLAGIVLAGEDQSRVDVDALDGWLPEAWRGGVPVLADNAMTAVLGRRYSAHPPTPERPDLAELATQKSLLAGVTSICPGLGFLDAAFEPQLSHDNRWGRLFSLAYDHPATVAFGLDRDTALEVEAAGAHVLGRRAVVSLDLRQADLALGTNDGFVIANGLLDVFAPGDEVQPLAPHVDAVAASLSEPALVAFLPEPVEAEEA
jgi:cyanophycinase